MDNRTENNPEITASQPEASATAPGSEGAAPEAVPAVPAEIIPGVPVAAVPEVKAPPAWKAFPIRDYIVNIALSVVLLYALNNLLNIYVPWIPSDPSKLFWNVLNNVYNHVEIPHLSKAYVQCLWSINIALTVSIMGNFILLLYRPRWFQHLVRAAIYAFGILPVYVIYAIYPFNFDSARINNSIKAVLIIGMVGLLTGAVIALVRFIKELVLARRNRKTDITPVPPVPPLPPTGTEEPGNLPPLNTSS